MDGSQNQIIREQNLVGTSYTPGNQLQPGTFRSWIRAVSAAGEASPLTGIVVAEKAPLIEAGPNIDGSRPASLPVNHDDRENKKESYLRAEPQTAFDVGGGNVAVD